MNKTHRVGTITLGGLLIAFGLLFLLKLFINTISYAVIFKLWPIIFIFLGIEILVANFKQKGTTLIYDKTAFVLIVLLSFFAMGMSITDFVVTHLNQNISTHISF